MPVVHDMLQSEKVISKTQKAEILTEVKRESEVVYSIRSLLVTIKYSH